MAMGSPILRWFATAATRSLKRAAFCAARTEDNMISQFENKPTARAQRGYTLCKVTGRAGLWSVLGVSGLACCDGAGFSGMKVLSIMPKQQNGKYRDDQVDQQCQL